MTKQDKCDKMVKEMRELERIEKKALKIVQKVKRDRQILRKEYEEKFVQWRQNKSVLKSQEPMGYTILPDKNITVRK